jgi:glycerol-3-phosphate dehydrogenase
MFDVVIVGAGVIGCSIARELSKYKLKVCVLEKGSDLALGTSKANSGIVHAGFDAKPESLKGKLNAKGNAMFDRLSKELDFPFKRNGSLVICSKKEDLQKLEELKQRGEANGVPGIGILDKKRLLELEPNLSEEVIGALYAPSGGIVSPYEMTIAYAENAYANGVEFKMNCEVVGIEKADTGFVLDTTKEKIKAAVVINAAGLFADDLNNMISKNKIKIIGRKGEYCLFDKSVGNIITRTIFQLPTNLGKGVVVTPTVDGNLLIGPNAVNINNKLDVSSTQEGLDEIITKAKNTLKEVPMRQVITSFAGLRAHSTADDFIIGESEDVKGFINVAGIESPGLSSAPAIAEMVEDIVVDKLKPSKKESFNPIRHGIRRFREMSNEERKELIKKDSSYGKIVCRCETITEGEVLDAIRRPLGATDLDGIKRRTRAGGGRCQGGFCSTKIVAILAKELNIKETEVTKFGGNSRILVGENKKLL